MEHTRNWIKVLSLKDYTLFRQKQDEDTGKMALEVKGVCGHWNILVPEMCHCAHCGENRESMNVEWPKCASGLRKR